MKKHWALAGPVREGQVGGKEVAGQKGVVDGLVVIHPGVSVPGDPDKARPTAQRVRALNLVPLVSFTILIAGYFKFRDVLATVQLDIQYTEGMAPAALWQLGSTVWEALALVVFWLVLHPILWPKDPSEHTRRKTSAMVIDLAFSPVALLLIFFPRLLVLYVFTIPLR
jgi:hypothetical protein